MTEATERIWSQFSYANERNPAQLHRWRLVVAEVIRSRVPADDGVLDLGCGNGALLERIKRASPSASLIGIDLEARALDLAKARLPQASFYQADLNDDTFEVIDALAGKVGVVVCSEVLEHLATPEKAIALARRLLHAGGQLIVTVPSGPMNAFDRSIGHVRHHTPESLEALLRAGSFRVERCYRWGFPFHTLYRVGIGLAPGSTESFSDASMNGVKKSIFVALDWLFRLNLRSRTVGRQLVAVASAV